MFLKIPSIAYNVGGIASLNKDTENVVSVERGDIKTLADSIVYLLSHNDRAASLAENAFLRVKKRFQNDLIYSDLISIYRRIVDEKCEVALY
jgi:glycosyltransferase involved in cell wall biosynthesis